MVCLRIFVGYSNIHMDNKSHKLVLCAFILTCIVILLGAYTRLKDAGLGCPDWPGCYGKLIVSNTDGQLNSIALNKAWIEMVHRYIAGTLGLLILLIAILHRNKLTAIVLCLTIFQALLGMWTVTLRLTPIVVVAHLLGGFSICALLWLTYLQLVVTNKFYITLKYAGKLLAILGTLALICQIALGGWVSASYSALVLNDIQMAHRIGAAITAVFILTLCCYLKKFGVALALLVVLQIILGITNVLASLPIAISLTHTAVAVVLLNYLITVLYLIYAKRFAHK